MVRPPHGQPHRVETGFLGASEELIVEAKHPVAFDRGFQHVAEVDAAAEAPAGRLGCAQPERGPHRARDETEDGNCECDYTDAGQALLEAVIAHTNEWLILLGPYPA